MDAESTPYPVGEEGHRLLWRPKFQWHRGVKVLAVPLLDLA